MELLNLFCKSREFKGELEASRERLFRVAYSWSHEPALADDLVQETLEKALKYSGQLRDPGALNAWLLSILTNCWRDYFRGRKDMLDIDQMELVHELTPEYEQNRHQIITHVRAAIAELPLRQRQVVTLVDLGECSYIETAVILNIPIGTVMSRLCRARNALKSTLLADDIVTEDQPVHIRKVQ